jgi:hypothetical protein
MYLARFNPMADRTAVSDDVATSVAPSLESTGPATKRSPGTRKPRRTTVAKAKTAIVKPKSAKLAAPPRKAARASRAKRTSEILLDILERNPQEQITVQQIVNGLGTTSFGTSLMVFSIPEVVPIPIPGMSAIVAIPTAVISAQMILGHGEMKLPKAFLKRSFPRKAFAAAVKAIMPHLEKAEKRVKPRWSWASTPAAKRFLGVFVFLLSAVMVLPIPMTNMPLAISIFLIGLGLTVLDGKMITAGVILGLASIALVGGLFFGLFSLFGGAAA